MNNIDIRDSIGKHIIQRLYSSGVRHIFGVAGDYILNFFEMIENSSIKLICTCDEQGAGFAADAYARLNGLGVICITYGVGGLKVVNSTAQAYAEKSPLMIISGAPGIKERKRSLLHHIIRSFDTQLNIFKEVTVYSIALNNPKTAALDFDNALLSCLRYKRPVYVELPRDMFYAPLGDYHKLDLEYKSNPNSLRESLKESIEMITKAKKPIIIAGEEIQRFKLQDKLLKLIEKTKIPVVSTILSKSVINEYHQLYMGVYQGAVGNESVREYVENSDCLIIIGALLSDITLGMFTANLDQDKTIYVTNEELSIKYHKYENVTLNDFIEGLIELLPNRDSDSNTITNKVLEAFIPQKGARITLKRLFQCINSFLREDMALIADVGEALFGSTDLIIQRGTVFLSSAYYTSMGFAIPASIGVQLADQRLRPIVLVGDGSFQMTGMEISTAVRYNLNPIVIVLNNKGYSTERVILDGPFNDLQNWNYELIPSIINKGIGFIVNTEEEFYNALIQAEKSNSISIINVNLDPNDRSKVLQRIAEQIGNRLREEANIYEQ